jgi:NADPH:quinone reductase-like Zn-dependent oxidoreductase/pimeloyl-ACP methyl ester carboxylesterase
VSAIRKAYVDTAAGQVHLRRVDGPGDPVILLHRTPVSSASFEAVLERLAGRRAAIALDTPGFGQSFKPVGRPSTVDYGAWLLAAIDALDIDRFHLVGHHTGTHLAGEIAVAAPERVRSLLLNGVLFANASEREMFRTQVGSAAPIDAHGAYLIQSWGLMKGMFPGFRANLVQTEFLGAIGAPEGRDQAFGAIFDQDFPAVFESVSCPVTVLQAVDDPLAGFAGRIRRARRGIVVTTQGKTGVAAPELEPEIFAETVLAFAAGVETTPPNTPLQWTPPMTDRRFSLVRASQGFELAESIVPVPTPGPGEVLVRVRAAALNRRDVMIRQGWYPVGEADGFTPLSDAAGEIAAVGEGVDDLKVGDRVASTFFQAWAGGRPDLGALMSSLGAGGRGVLAEHVVLSAKGVTLIPDSLDFESAATLTCSGVTAWAALMTHGGLEAGDWVLTLGTGGVSLYALQIAVAAGAKVAIISSSDKKLAIAKTLGASVGVNYETTPDWEKAILEATGGVQHAIELGGAGTLAKSQACLAPGGHLALIGALDGFGGDISAAGLTMGAQRVSALAVGSRADQLALSAFVAQHGIKPVIDSVFGLNDIEAAYARAGEGGFGKVVVKF